MCLCVCVCVRVCVCVCVQVIQALSIRKTYSEDKCWKKKGRWRLDAWGRREGRRSRRKRWGRGERGWEERREVQSGGRGGEGEGWLIPSSRPAITAAAHTHSLNFPSLFPDLEIYNCKRKHWRPRISRTHATIFPFQLAREITWIVNGKWGEKIFTKHGKQKMIMVWKCCFYMWNTIFFSLFFLRVQTLWASYSCHIYRREVAVLYIFSVLFSTAWNFPPCLPLLEGKTSRWKPLQPKASQLKPVPKLYSNLTLKLFSASGDTRHSSRSAAQWWPLFVFLRRALWCDRESWVEVKDGRWRLIRSL